MNKWKIKFNSGNLAILCSKCSKIIKTGKDFTQEELNAVQESIALPPYFCENCIPTYKVFISRYGTERYFEQQDNGDYLVYGETEFMRCSKQDYINYIDFVGGPMISVGLSLECYGLSGVVDAIKFEEDSELPNCFRLIMK
jgi:hypothetical protein